MMIQILNKIQSIRSKDTSDFFTVTKADCRDLKLLSNL